MQSSYGRILLISAINFCLCSVLVERKGNLLGDRTQSNPQGVLND